MRTMRTSRTSRTSRTPSPGLRAILGTLVVIAAAGCSGDSPTGSAELGIADLAGTWISEAFVMTSRDQPSVTLDLMALGASITWAVKPSGAFSGTAVLPGGGFSASGTLTVPMSGVLRIVDAETIRVDFVPEIPPMFATFIGSFTFGGDAMTIVDDDETVFDFDGDGVPEPATLHTRFRRH
jgi:hypothetical protein